MPALGGVTLEPGVEQQLRGSASALIAHTGMVEIDLSIEVPNLAAQWMMGNLATLLADPQTSGGLLVACEPGRVDPILALFRAEGFAQAAVIGEIAAGMPRVSVR